MTLEAHFNETMNSLLETQTRTPLSCDVSNQIIQSLDLTLLDEYAETTVLSQLEQAANKHQVAAICVYAKHLPLFSSSNRINLACVINFPQGNEPVDASLEVIENAARHGAAEIDYVFPWRMYLDGYQQKALDQCSTVAQCCTAKGLILKLILETGAFPDMETIYKVCRELIALNAGVFLKTSTGKIPQGATLPAVFSILSAIKDSQTAWGLKVSGGVKTAQEAHQYVLLAETMLEKRIDKSWLRIGASSLLQELLP